MNVRSICASLLMGCTTVAALAQTPPAAGASTPVVDARQAKQDARIKQGVASGELTQREAHKLRAEQRAINRAEAKAKSDGVVTKGERGKLQHMQDHASRDVYRQKHDRQRRPASAP